MESAKRASERSTPYFCSATESFRFACLFNVRSDSVSLSSPKVEGGSERLLDAGALAVSSVPRYRFSLLGKLYLLPSSAVHFDFPPSSSTSVPLDLEGFLYFLSYCSQASMLEFHSCIVLFLAI